MRVESMVVYKEWSIKLLLA